MQKKRKPIGRKRAHVDIGICFEPLEPRLLLSGTWGAVVDGPTSDSQANAAGGFGSEMATLSEGSTGFGLQALSHNQSTSSTGTQVNELADASVLKGFDAGDPAAEIPANADRAKPARSETAATFSVDSDSRATNPGRQSHRSDASGPDELVFINENVDGYEEIVDGLISDPNRAIEVVILEADRDGFQQVDEIETM